MKFVIGTDESRPVVEHLAARLRERGHETTILPVATWGEMAIGVGERVASRLKRTRPLFSNPAPGP
jgi:hypothetical protein